MTRTCAGRASTASHLSCTAFDPSCQARIGKYNALEKIINLSVVEAFDRLVAFVGMGGAAMWAMTILLVITVALIVWKAMRLLTLGAWSGGARTEAALELWGKGQTAAAIASLEQRRSLRAQLACAAMQATLKPELDQTAVEAETARVGTGVHDWPVAGVVGHRDGHDRRVSGLARGRVACQPRRLCRWYLGSLADPRRRYGRGYSRLYHADVV